MSNDAEFAELQTYLLRNHSHHRVAGKGLAAWALNALKQQEPWIEPKSFGPTHAAEWHRVVEVMCTILGIDGTGSSEEVLAAFAAWRDRQEPVASTGEVLVEVSGYTGSGKSAVAGEIEIAMRAIGLKVEWERSSAEKHMTGADWQTALEMYAPHIRIVERNVTSPTRSTNDSGRTPRDTIDPCARGAQMIDLMDVLNALARQANDLEQHGRKLVAQHNYSAEFSLTDAEMLREAHKRLVQYAGTAIPLVPTHRHADGGLYRFNRELPFRMDDSDFWITAVLYTSIQSGEEFGTTMARWRRRFRPV